MNEHELKNVPQVEPVKVDKTWTLTVPDVTGDVTYQGKVIVDESTEYEFTMVATAIG